MVDSDSQWWEERSKERSEYVKSREASIIKTYSDIDELFGKLSQSLAAQISSVTFSAYKDVIERENEALQKKNKAELKAKDRDIELLRLRNEKIDLEITHQEAIKNQDITRTEVSEKLKKANENLISLKKANTELLGQISKDQEALKRIKAETEAELLKSEELKSQADKIKQEQSKSIPGNVETKLDAKLDAKPATKSETKPETKPEAKPELQAKPEIKPEIKTFSTVPGVVKSKNTIEGSPGDSDYAENMKKIEWIKNNVKLPYSQLPSEDKNYMTNIKLEMRPKFGMLTNSKAQLVKTRNSVKELLTQAKQRPNPIIYQYALNLYAKMLVEQSESEAKVLLQNALPLAMLTILLWADFPEIGDFVIPRFVKKCPQLVGYYCDISTDEGRKRMAWKKDEDSGKYENEDEYMQRLAGVCAVWACMTQSKLTQKIEHPYPLSHSWTFLSRLLNKPPNILSSSDYCIAAAWWDMTALRFSQAFGKQGLKLLELAWNNWTEGRTDQPALRLRGLGENWKDSGEIDHGWKPLV